MVKVCVVGCLHGELDRVYEDIRRIEIQEGFKTDLVLCCGDFQSVRNPADLTGMSVPPKYYRMGDFWRYYAEEVRAPILTLFVGGNHEASSYLQELPYGGWVAPNIWYMGYAGVVQFAGLRIAGLSGIYKQHDYTMCHYEHPPYSESSKRSAYHVRNLDVFRLGQIRRRLDIVLSHDWPRGIYHYGNVRKLIEHKRHFRDEINSDSLGSPPSEQLLCRLKPRYWFSAHLHCRFAAVVEHKLEFGQDKVRQTKFLALDKCLPNRNYIQFVDIEPEPVDQSDIFDNPIIVSKRASMHNDTCPNSDSKSTNNGDPGSCTSTNLYLDPEWLCILKSTNHLMSVNKVPCILPEKQTTERCDYSATEEEINEVSEPFGGEFSIPENFERTAPVHKLDNDSFKCSNPNYLNQLAQESKVAKQIFSNPQTELICAMLELMNPNAVCIGKESYNLYELSAQIDSKHLDEEEEEDQDEEGGGVSENESCKSNETGHHHLTGWKSIDDYADNEYDPLRATNTTYDPTSTSTQGIVSQNPEELELDLDDDDEEEDEDATDVGVQKAIE